MLDRFEVAKGRSFDGHPFLRRFRTRGNCRLAIESISGSWMPA
ncbi:hypothetical protein [Polaromonas sp. CG9_12]|nr:hypothetical protein [Polaromonas sp. CG9_12]